MGLNCLFHVESFLTLLFAIAKEARGLCRLGGIPPASLDPPLYSIKASFAVMGMSMPLPMWRSYTL